MSRVLVQKLLAAVLVVVALVAVVGALRPAFDKAARAAGWGAEALLVLYVANDLLSLLSGDKPNSMITHLGYAIAAVGLIPVLMFRAPPEPEDGEAAEEEAAPASLWVLAVACLACAVVVIRMAQTR